MTDIIILALTNTISIICLLLLLRYVFGAKLMLNLKKMLVLAAVYFVYGMITYGLFGGVVGFVGVILFLLAVCLLTCKEKRWRSLLYLIPALMLYSQFSMYIAMFDRLIGKDSNVISQFTDVFLLILLLAWALWMEKNRLQFSLGVGECLFLIFFGLIACFYGDVMDMIERYMPPQKVTMLMQLTWILFVTILNGCVIATIAFRRKHAYQKKLSDCYRQYFEQEYQAFNKKRENQQEQDRLRHDWKNHVNTLQTMWEKGEATQAVRYVAGLAEESKSCAYTILSGNEVADAILNLKYEKAQEEGISFRFTGSLAGLSSLEPMDICVLLGNALDNALENCEKNSRKSSIRIEASENGNFLLLTIENTLHEPIVLRDNRLVTSKKNASEHGFGIIGMEHVVHKYEGNMRFDITEECFKVQVILPFADKKEEKP